MHFIKSLLRSIFYAFRGLLKTIREERNFRIQLISILYVSAFAFFYGLDRTQWAVLCLTFCIVPVTELINTSIENTVDIKTRKYNYNAQIAKDLAAASVLFSSIVSIIVAICLFSEKEKLLTAIQTVFSLPWIIIIGISLFPAIIFIKGNIKKEKKQPEDKKDQ